MKTPTLTLALLSILYLLNSSYPQVQQDWVARYNGPGNGADFGVSIVIDGFGNVFITGASYGNGSDYDYATVKYNSSGVQQWVQRYNGPANSSDFANAIAIDNSGNVYVTGNSWGTGTSNDYATLKYNSSGALQWVQRYNGPGNGIDWAHSIALDNSANVYVTGGSTGSGTSDDYATIKYNSAGVQQWVARYNGTAYGSEEALSIAVDGQGNVYVTGYSSISGAYSDYATIKYNSAGVQQWVQRYGLGQDADIARSVVVDASGNVYVTGRSMGIGTDFDCATIKYNQSGIQQWVQRYNGPGNGYDEGNSIAVDGSGNVYVSGISFGSATYADYATIKYNAAGVQQWINRYNGPGSYYDYAYSITLDGAANVYVTGGSTGNGTDFDYTTIKYNSSGIQQWLQSYNGTGNSSDFTSSVKVDGSGNVYVTGYSIGSGTGYDFTTIKYSQPIGITPISNQIPEFSRLFQNYPNPFNPVTRIRFDISPVKTQSKVSLLIYEILGREVATLVYED